MLKNELAFIMSKVVVSKNRIEIYRTIKKVAIDTWI